MAIDHKKKKNDDSPVSTGSDYNRDGDNSDSTAQPQGPAPITDLFPNIPRKKRSKEIQYPESSSRIDKDVILGKVKNLQERFFNVHRDLERIEVDLHVWKSDGVNNLDDAGKTVFNNLTELDVEATNVEAIISRISENNKELDSKKMNMSSKIEKRPDNQMKIASKIKNPPQSTDLKSTTRKERQVAFDEFRTPDEHMTSHNRKKRALGIDFSGEGNSSLVSEAEFNGSQDRCGASSASTQSYCYDKHTKIGYKNTNTGDDGDSCSNFRKLYHKNIDTCNRIELKASIHLLNNVPKKKRSVVLSKTSSGNDDAFERIKNELRNQFMFLVKAQEGSETEYDEHKILDRIKELLVMQSQVFLQDIGVDIDETSILNILQGNIKESQIETEVLDSDNKRTPLQVDKSDTPIILEKIILETNKRSIDDNTNSILNSSNPDPDGAVTLPDKKTCNDQAGVISDPSIKKKNTVNMPEHEGKECKQTFTDFRALGGHIASHNRIKNMSELKGIKSNYQCNICNEEFEDFRALGGHIASHNRKKRACEAAFAGRDGSNLVAELNDKGREKSYECNICSRKFSTGQALGGHKALAYHRNIADDNSGFHDKSSQATFSAQNPVFDNSGIQNSSGQATSSAQNPVFDNSGIQNFSNQAACSDQNPIFDNSGIQDSSGQMTCTQNPVSELDLNATPDEGLWGDK